MLSRPKILLRRIVPYMILCGTGLIALRAQQAGAPGAPGGGRPLLEGSVLDPSGAAVPDAKVSAQCGPYRSETISDGGGHYQVELRQNTCTILVTAKGFAPFSQVFERRRGSVLDLRLALGSQEVVTVNARQDAVDVSKINADPMDLPLAVESVPIQLAQDQGFTRLFDVVRNVSGVVGKDNYYGATDTFNVRGFDASSGLFNGFRRDYYGTVNDIASLERIEVIKGPSSVTGGFLEPGGVVNVVTKRPYEQLGSEFSLMTTTFGTVRGTGDVNVPLSSKLFLRGTGSAEHRASWRDYVKSGLNHFGLAVDWTPTASTLLESRIYNTYLSSVPDSGLEIPFALALQLPRERLIGDPQDQYKQRNANLSEMVRQGLGKSWSFRTGVSFSQLSDYRNNVEVLGPDASNPTLIDRELTIVPGDASTVNAVAELFGEVTTYHVRHHITGGVDYQRLYSYNYFTQNYDLPVFNPFQPNYGGYPRVQGPVTDQYYGYTYDTGTYVQDLLSLGSHIRVLLGARQDEFNYHDHELVGMTSVRLKQGAFSPRVGLVYQPIHALSFYGNYASSFNPQPGVVLLNGQDPAPSRGRQIEVGVKYNTSGRFTMSADLFRIRKTNVATAIPGNQNFSQLTGEEQSTGAEFDSTFRLRKGLTVRANIADTRAIVSADTSIPVGNRLINVPRLQGTLWTDLEVPHTKLTANFGWFAVGQREQSLPNIDPFSGQLDLIPKYNRFDAALAYQLRPGLRLQTNLQNISNVRYFESQDYDLMPGAPINVEFTVRWTPQRRH